MTATGAVPVPPLRGSRRVGLFTPGIVARVVLTAGIVGLLVYYVGFSEIATTVAKVVDRRGHHDGDHRRAQPAVQHGLRPLDRVPRDDRVRPRRAHLSRHRRQSVAARTRSPPVGVDGDRRGRGCCGARRSRCRPSTDGETVDRTGRLRRVRRAHRRSRGRQPVSRTRLGKASACAPGSVRRSGSGQRCCGGGRRRGPSLVSPSSAQPSAG